MIFEPFQINGVEFKNRLLRSSMGGRMAYYDGEGRPPVDPVRAVPIRFTKDGEAADVEGATSPPTQSTAEPADSFQPHRPERRRGAWSRALPGVTPLGKDAWLTGPVRRQGTPVATAIAEASHRMPKNPQDLQGEEDDHHAQFRPSHARWPR
jgi:hypothetical protein